MKSIPTILHNHPNQIIVFMILLIAIGGLGASKSQVDNSLEVWQSHDDANWLAYQDFLEKSNLSDPLIIFIPTELDPFVVEEISDSISDLPFTSTCQDLKLTSKNKPATLFNITPIQTATPAQLSELLREIQTIIKDQEIPTFHFGGVWYLTNQLDTLSAGATTILFPVVLLVVSLIVFIICRRQAFLILVCGLIPALLLVGIMGFCSVKMNMVLLALPPLTLILGLAHGIHFTIKVWDPDDTPLTIFKRVAPPCTLSGLTTTLGFGSLLFSSYQPVRTLGLWGGIGCLLSLGITFMIVPVFLTRGHPLKYQLPQDLSQRLAKNKAKIGGSLAVILILAVLGLNRLQTGSLILEFFEPESVVSSDYNIIEESGIGLTPLEVNLFQRGLTRPILDGPLTQLAQRHPEITHFIFTMTDESQQVLNFGATFHAPELATPHLEISRITILMHTISSEATMTMVHEVEQFFQQQLGLSETPYITGSVPLYTYGQQELFSSMLRSFSIAFMMITLLIGLVLHSTKMAFVTMVPNLLPVILVLAMMGWLSIPLSVATMTVASIIFGIIVDDTIHYLYTYQNTPTIGHDRLNYVFKQVGAPIIMTTIVTGTGFLAFLASPFIPLGHFGLLISLALWFALLCDLFILPLLLMGKNNV